MAEWEAVLKKVGDRLRIGVCGVACEKCPRMVLAKCPSGDRGCVPNENKFCKISTCAFKRNVRTCFQCVEFPCETTKSGPISYEYCRYISGKEE